MVEHPIYQLDKVIVTYLDGLFREEVGEPFIRWEAAEDEAARQHEDATRKLGRTAISLPTEEWNGQETLVVGAMLYRPLNEAWQALVNAGGPRWRGLLEFYASVKTELRDLENMNLALQVAEAEGNPEYVTKVKEILGLDEITEPLWWNME